MVAEGYKQTEVGVIPEDWKIKDGENLTSLISKGASPKWQGYAYADSGMLFVTSENVRQGYLDISKPKFLPIEFNSKIKRSQVQIGDVLINLVGASIGRSCQVKSDLGIANVNQAVAVYRMSEDENSEYVAAYFTSSLAVRRIMEMQVDAA
ncbi:MAG: type I restriction enzyme S subunit [Rubritalea sp.]|jgi:type I restriction enzyme S subunit